MYKPGQPAHSDAPIVLLHRPGAQGVQAPALAGLHFPIAHSTQNVGIGTTAPPKDFTVEGDISMSGTGQLTHSGQFYNEAGNMKIGQSDTSKKQTGYFLYE